MLTSAYRYADASLIAPFDYVSMVLALLIGIAALVVVRHRANIARIVAGTEPRIGRRG